MSNTIRQSCLLRLPIAVAARSKACVCGSSLAGTVGSNLARGMDVFLLCACCQVSASGLALVQRCPTKCGVSECNREASAMRTPWLTRECRPIKRMC
jgi:hypothetical protein